LPNKFMYKIAGLGHFCGSKYFFGVISPSDSSKQGLGFFTQEEAQTFADRMNKSLENFDTDETWNKQFWKTKPEPFIVFPVL